ncbi:MAG: hypothetical protein AAFO69_18300, partial [Bacteroidota bacterium]
SHGVFAQVAVNEAYDINGLRINQYYDFLEHPANAISCEYFIAEFEKGSYYDAVGNKHDGLIKFEKARIFFKEQPRDEQKKIQAAKMRGFRVGIDSFMVVQNNYKSSEALVNIDTRSRFAQHIATIGDHTFVRIFDDREYGAFTYLIKRKGDQKWEKIPQKKREFINTLSDEGIDLTLLLANANSLSYFGHENLYGFIKTLEYLNKYERQEPLYFTMFGREATTIENTYYKAIITKVTDAMFQLDYYHDDVKRYSVSYTSFFPHTKTGQFIAYAPDGSVRKVSEYVDNHLYNVAIFKNGTPYYKYHKIRLQMPDDPQTAKGKNTGVLYKYDYLNDANGEDILASGGRQVEKPEGLPIINMYEGTKPVNSRYQVDGVTYFQPVGEKNQVDFSKITENISRIRGAAIADAVYYNEESVLLLELYLNEYGYISDYKLLNNINESVQEQIKMMLERAFNSEAYMIRLKPLKYEKKKVASRIIVPIDFLITRFKEPVERFYFDFFNSQFHNQMMQMNMPTPTPPRMN